MREAEIKVGTSSFRVALPLGALDDLASKGVDPFRLVTRGSEPFSLQEVRALIDVGGAWGIDPVRGRPSPEAGALTFGTVYSDMSGGLIACIDIANAVLALAFKDSVDTENPTKGEGDAA